SRRACAARVRGPISSAPSSTSGSASSLSIVTSATSPQRTSGGPATSSPSSRRSPHSLGPGERPICLQIGFDDLLDPLLQRLVAPLLLELLAVDVESRRALDSAHLARGPLPEHLALGIGRAE